MVDLSLGDMKIILDKLDKSSCCATCAAKSVGCVLFNRIGGNYIIEGGYNKSVSPIQCRDRFRKIEKNWFYLNKNNEWKHDETGIKHKIWSIQHEVHAEIMALTNYHTDNADNLIAVVTWSPCLDCCKSLINAGVKDIFYMYEFDNFEEIDELCKECKVNLIKFTRDADKMNLDLSKGIYE